MAVAAIIRYSSPRCRTSFTHAKPTTAPTAAPPTAKKTNAASASVVLNVLPAAAATAKRNSTSPLASFRRLSPSRRIWSRLGILTLSSTARPKPRQEAKRLPQEPRRRPTGGKASGR